MVLTGHFNMNVVVAICSPVITADMKENKMAITDRNPGSLDNVITDEESVKSSISNWNGKHQILQEKRNFQKVESHDHQIL